MFAGPVELSIILIVVVFLFGAKRIPKITNALGKSVAELSNAKRRAEVTENNE